MNALRKSYPLHITLHFAGKTGNFLAPRFNP